MHYKTVIFIATFARTSDHAVICHCAKEKRV